MSVLEQAGSLLHLSLSNMQKGTGLSPSTERGDSFSLCLFSSDCMGRKRSTGQGPLLWAVP